MSWVWNLIENKYEDFWLNVFAGIPFMLFDFIIITMLLPVTVKWWEERSWHRARLRSLDHLFARYRSRMPPEMLSRFHATLGKHANQYRNFLGELKRADAEMDSSLQTVLPILGPAITDQMLTFHYEWKKFTVFLIDHGDQLLNQVSWHIDPKTGRKKLNPPEDHEMLGDSLRFQNIFKEIADAAVDVTLQLLRLEITYSLDTRALERTRERGHLPILFWNILEYFALYIHVYDLDLVREEKEKVPMGIEMTLRNFMDERRDQEPMVKLYRRDNALAWLFPSKKASVIAPRATVPATSSI